ncbi:MAG: hypothetical protein HC878_18560 [Leptolyngbyaceae cyanobacterium SL_5_14]|nr:hypothetical protein [Leptolyngbyaceae cyanobacterium SL_5_14]
MQTSTSETTPVTPITPAYNGSDRNLSESPTKSLTAHSHSKATSKAKLQS